MGKSFEQRSAKGLSVGLCGLRLWDILLDQTAGCQELRLPCPLIKRNLGFKVTDEAGGSAGGVGLTELFGSKFLSPCLTGGLLGKMAPYFPHSPQAAHILEGK